MLGKEPQIADLIRGMNSSHIGDLMEGMKTERIGKDLVMKHTKKDGSEEYQDMASFMYH